MREYRYLVDQAERFVLYLREQERAKLTVEKYVRDVRGFLAYFRTVARPGKGAVIDYKTELERKYAVSSVNSILSAVNSFLKFAGLEDWCVRHIRVQRRMFCAKERELTKEEYQRLLRTAKERRNLRLYMLLQTLCATGIRVSELPGITVEAVRTGRSEICCKGKCRVILLPGSLCRGLARYIREKNIKSGSIFITRSGKPLDRSNIWSEMKMLCAAAGVSPSKVFPHNLRHLFARTYYRREKDLTRLADLLGHSNINTTRIYIISSGEEHERQIDHMGLTCA